MNRLVNQQVSIPKGARQLAWSMLIIFCIGLFSPSVSIAGGGGPTQPEVHGFTPIGVSDMVDPFTGDFSYNIPLMDVEGYPINIAYSSGVTMDQEASWVGLGWNLNMGAIVRSMRGLPDDFNGDEVEHTQSQRPQEDFGISLAGSWEIIGKKIEAKGSDSTINTIPTSLSLKANMNLHYNNYTGYGVTLGFGPAFSFKQLSEVGWGAGASLSGSSENGAGFTPNLTLSKKLKTTDDVNRKLGFSLGGGFNTRAGLTHLSYGMSLSKEKGKGDDKQRMSSNFSSSYNPGLHHYMPSTGPNFSSLGLSGNFTVTYATALGFDREYSMGLTYNVQKIKDEEITRINPAYGFFHLESGQHGENALLDFNRDNDGSFTKYTPNLPSAYLTSDIFSIQAQGVGGSFKGYRNEIGYVFDPLSKSSSTSGSLGLEFGLGQNFDLGVDVQLNITESTSGSWTNSTNQAKNTIGFESESGLLEEFALKNASERSIDADALITTIVPANNVQKFNLDGSDLFPYMKNQLNGTNLTSNERTSRYKRNELLTFLTIADVKNDLGLDAVHLDLYPGAKDHHIGEMTQLGTDGRRYVFGIPAYNHFQEDVTFAVGDNIKGELGAFPTEDYSGLLTLDDGDLTSLASEENNRGIDRYYSSETTPAYAHSFLLTAVLSDDYNDTDGHKGPSEDDLGSYVKFNYEKHDNIKWRAPIENDKVYHNPGLKTDLTDDKASFVYGEKEVWYVKGVETKNYIAVFELENRRDGVTTAGRNGGLNMNGESQQCLKKITLYAKPDYEVNGANAIPLQEVHFVYDYSLCPGYAGSYTGEGKLTLREIYFTYQNSNKMKRSSYKFDYANNAPYDMKAVDRWGNYKTNGSGTVDYLNDASPLTNAENPYTSQDETTANNNSSKWCLSDIYLPTGGKIHVDYESDDYAYVQHLRASQMYPIAYTGDANGDFNAYDELQVISVDGDNENRAIFFKMKTGYTNLADYGKVGNPVHYRCLVDMFPDAATSNRFEYISGYGIIKELDRLVKDNDTFCRITLEGTNLRDIDTDKKYSPITKSAILFARLHLSRMLNNSLVDSGEPEANEASVKSLAQAFVASIESFKELVTGPNKFIYDQDKCQKIVVGKSFVRMLEPSKRKFGGGVRVKRILMYDNWNYMVRNTDVTKNYDFTYGQEFDYTLEDGTSSGVASYEPQLGGDENSWHQPHFYNEKFRFAPDNELYLERPIMESQFPSPSVGYSRVTITDLKHDGVKRTATGKVVKEFYTAKDFPTIVKNSDIDVKVANSYIPLLPQYDYLTASQGFSIQLNDMHGKPKAETVYAENRQEPISSVYYGYKKKNSTFLGIDCFELDNEVQVIQPNGSTTTTQLGVNVEAVADFRENKTSSIGGSFDYNTNGFFAGPVYLIIPALWSKIDISNSKFRSATMNKVVNKFGIADTVLANQDGSIVTTNNLAYDSETGDVLVTETTTNFNDKVYSLNYPAYWKHDQMGQAYKNIGYSISGYPIGADGFAPVGGATSNFVPGDEVKVTGANYATPVRAWVSEITPDGIRLIDSGGQPLTTNGSTITIIRSGRRNKQTASMASISTLDNPIGGLANGVFTKVLNAGAIEFSEDWATYCNCFNDAENTDLSISTNPYITGTKGNWRPVKSNAYLTNRTQTDFNSNTNIRRDGIFASYTPFYRYLNGSWQIFRSNWTYVTKVTEFSPNGMTLETQDALGRYSASLFGFNGTLATAVAANSRLSQLVEGSFEDQAYSNCMDQGFFKDINPTKISSTVAHTGRNSVALGSNETLQIAVVIPPCIKESTCDIAMTALSGNTFQLSGCDGTCSIQTVSAPYGTGSVSTPDVNGVVTVTYTTGSYFERIVKVNGPSNRCILTVKISSVPPSNNQLNLEVISLSEN